MHANIVNCDVENEIARALYKTCVILSCKLFFHFCTNATCLKANSKFMMFF